ncbi:MAG TPA: hypothetical protein GXX69_07360 [Firmicutes bacterium]|nr:hypothetical protein [Bacillota bacterium]
MLEVKGDSRAGWSRLVKVAEEQGALYGAMIKATQLALQAAEAMDTDVLEEVLADREKLIQKVQAIQAEERELRLKVGGEPALDLREQLKAASDLQLDQLKKVVELNTKLEQELVNLKKQLTHDLDQVSQLKKTAQGYRPKDLSTEGLFVDWKR